ncbi:hypothetical protein [Glaesserella parasuis]|nr:hypothetical protein [Glaesserella parasuis]MDE4016783.1 hypothetical protein [Glaesserella parasuis]MDO9729503.1 hypothetical protein [Glaesserella parasuis]MDO9740604.1 hypothetical protein [Glaesserella parasuis]MDO9762474.1 hypothetical protein [Glaesserella parasuis]
MLKSLLAELATPDNSLIFAASKLRVYFLPVVPSVRSVGWLTVIPEFA